MRPKELYVRLLGLAPKVHLPCEFFSEDNSMTDLMSVPYQVAQAGKELGGPWVVWRAVVRI